VDGRTSFRTSEHPNGFAAPNNRIGGGGRKISEEPLALPMYE
jgi:hypothetical protein